MKNKKSSHVKIGDRVKIIAGNHKGILGTITTIFLKKSIVYIDSISPRLKSVKIAKENSKNIQELQIPIHFSNVMLWDNEKNVADRIGYKIVENKKRRYFRKSGNLV